MYFSQEWCPLFNPSIYIPGQVAHQSAHIFTYARMGFHATQQCRNHSITVASWQDTISILWPQLTVHNLTVTSAHNAVLTVHSRTLFMDCRHFSPWRQRKQDAYSKCSHSQTNNPRKDTQWQLTIHYTLDPINNCKSPSQLVPWKGQQRSTDLEYP